jgi:pimeloyl-ACP methyl ester carboxylesterase
MIHGAFAGPWCWDDYRAFFSEHGWTCHTPALRYHGGDPKADPDPDLANTSIADYANDIAAFVQTLDAKPILLGHAVGGMIAQQVASGGLASAVVAINPNAPWGMLVRLDKIKMTTISPPSSPCSRANAGSCDKRRTPLYPGCVAMRAHRTQP